MLGFLSQATTQPTTGPAVPAFLASQATIMVATDYIIGLLKPYLPAKVPVSALALVLAGAMGVVAVFVVHSISGDPVQIIGTLAMSAYAAYRAHTDFGPVGSLTQTTASSVANDVPATKTASKVP